MRLEDVYTYDPATGVFRYKIRRARMKVGSVAGADNGRYIQLSLGPKKILAHRAAWFFHYGEWPEQQIDHLDGNGKNNAISNLELVSGRENVNRGVQRHKKSGLPRGVTTQYGRFRAKAWINGKEVYLGYYDTPEQAHQVYLNAIQ